MQKQLVKFEDMGLLVSKFRRKTKGFMWNPRCYYLKEFRELLQKVFLSLPLPEQQKYNSVRQRPRKGDKKL